MSELESAIVRALKRHDGWATALQVRDMLPNGMPRGEGFDLALAQMVNSRRLQMRPLADGAIYRLAELDGLAPAPPAATPAPIKAPGPAAAMSDAFHPPRPALRVPMLTAGTDEVKPPNPNSVSQAKRKESSTMSGKAEST